MASAPQVIPSDPLGAFHQLRSELRDTAKVCGIDTTAPVASWCVFGSAVMRLHGLLARPMGDLDVFVLPQIWVRLAGHPAWALQLPDPAHPPFLERLYAGKHVHVFYDWRHDEPIRGSEVMARAEQVHGWWTARLEDVLAHKVYSVGKYSGSERHLKHRADAARIAEYLHPPTSLGLPR